MIQTNPEDIEQIRERFRKMSDLELRKDRHSREVICLTSREFGWNLAGRRPADHGPAKEPMSAVPTTKRFHRK
jgi:hypothetical protein